MTAEELYAWLWKNRSNQTYTSKDGWFDTEQVAWRLQQKTSDVVFLARDHNKILVADAGASLKPTATVPNRRKLATRDYTK